MNASLLREMWRTASSLELLPLGTKTELGDALVKRVKAGDYKESELWCLSRLGARKLFYGPINLVVPPATVTRWAEALLNLPQRRRRAGRDGAPHGRPHARSAARHARDASGASCKGCRTPSGCWRCSKAKRKTMPRWGGFSEKNCRRVWCWRSEDLTFVIFTVIMVFSKR